MKSIVLLSSGLDSSVNFCKAVQEGKVLLALTFDYGQRAAAKEIDQAKKICEKYSVKHQVITLDWLKQITSTSLVNKNKEIPQLNKGELDNIERTKISAKNVWVPNRNGVFINIAASFAEVLKADTIVVGFNLEEAKTFPDNSQDFVEHVNASLSLSTFQMPKVMSFTQNLNKEEIVRYGNALSAPFDLMWSCYEANQTPCGRCESCLRFDRAMKGGQRAKLSSAFA
jgi:7-cyano-7-deazaguanine synthase